MSEFKIKVSVQLDDSELNDKLGELEKNHEIPISLDMKKIDSQLKSLKTSFQDAFKIDSKALGDVNKLVNSLEKLNGKGGNTSSKNSSKQVSSLVDEYKNLYNTVEKLQKQMAKGGLGDESLKRTQKQIDSITNEMNRLRSVISDAENANLDLFESKKSLNSLTDFNDYLNKIETQASGLKNQIKEIDMNFLSDTSKSDLNKVTSAIDEIRNSAKDDILLEIEVGDALDKLNKASESIKKFQKESTESAKEYNKALGEQQKAQEKLVAQQQKDLTFKQNGEMKNLVNEYKDFSNMYSKLQKQMNSGTLGEDSIKRTAMQMSELKTNMSQLYDKMNSNAKQQIDLFNTKQMNKGIADMNSAMNKIESQATSLGTKLNSISFDHIDTSKIENIQSELKQIQDIAKQDIELDFNVGDILSDLNRLSSEIKNLEKVENLASSFDKISGSIKDAGGDVENFASSIKELENSADKIDGSFEKAFKKANDGLKDMQSSVKKISSDTNGKGLFGSILGSKDDFLGNFTSFTLAEVAGDFISDGIRQMASAWKDTVVETDAAITDLRKVYDKNLTGDALKGYLNSVTEVAKGTGKSSVDVIQGTAKAVQSGISDINDALTYAKQASIFSNVGDVTQEQADTMLASIMSVYGGVENALKPVREQIVGAGKDYNTLTKFMDLANYAGNNFAISTADVGEALQLSAAALKTNGVSMEESVGMITAMNEITQDSRRTGTALKTISANMAGVTTSAKDGTIQTNKAAKALKEIAGIDVWNKQTGEIKDMYTVMDELNGKWGDLSEAQRNALASTIAGKTQLNTFNALMSNWDTARQYVKEYKDGLMVGSAERENAQYLDSIAGKWNVIKENMKAAGNTLITSDMTKGFLDIGIVLSEGFNKGIQGITKGISLINKGELGKNISDSLYGALESLNLDNKFSNTLTDMIGNLGQGLFDNLKTGIFGKLFGGFGNSIKPIFDIFSKITDALPDDSILGKVGNKISELKDLANYKLFGGEKELNKQIDGRNENINAIKSEVQSLKNQKQVIEDILPTYDKLSKKTKLSASESQQLAEMRNQLADSNPDLVLGYDQNGTPILKNLQIQNKQLESQIKLKQQSQRLEENSLALDTLQRQTLGQKEFNKAYKEYNDMQLASDTKRKEGLFGKESTQDYAKRIIDDNKKIAEANQKAYEQRLKDHQQYVQDEQAIQQKYMNEMTQKSSFNRLSEEMKSGMLTFMDALDWSQFSPAEGSQFAGMLANLGDKLVPTTEAMGKQSKAIAQLTQDYADGKTNLINYTKGLTEQYEAAGKFDAESFSAWRQGLQSYVDTTGDLQGANKAIDEMATSLNKITGIKTDTWKTALSFDPAPIDASNKALQKFLNSYGTSVQNMGKGGMADKLTSQFETLQNSYMQMTSDLAEGKEIDVEYLVNAKVNQPEPIASLIDEIVSDNKVTEQEIDLLLTAQAEILNTGEISDETIKQIADEFNMTEEEVRLMLNVKTEVKEEGEPLEEVKSKWESLDIGEKVLSLIQKVTGGELIESARSTWDSMNIGEKIQTLIQMVTGGDLLGSAAQLFAGINVGQKIQELLQKVTGSDLVKSAGEWFSSLNVGQKIQELLQKVTGSDLVKSAGQWFNSLNVGQKIQELLQKVTGSDLVKSAGQWFNSLNVGQKIQELLQKVSGGDLLKSAAQHFASLNVGQKIQELLQKVSGGDLLKSASSFFSGIFQGTKNQTLEQKATGTDSVKEASNAMESLPSVKEVTISFIQSGKGLLDSISGFFKSKTEEKVSVSVQVTGKEQVESVKNAISSMQNKNISVSVNGNALSQVNQIKSALNGLQTKNISINASGNALSQINSIKSSLSGIQTKNISINASGNALGQINSIKSALSGLQSKSISVNASVNGAAQVNTLKASIASLQGKSVSVSCSTSGVGQVNSLTSAINRVKAKSVRVAANVSGTGQVNSLISAINRVKSKSVKISASVSGTGAVQGLASAIASVHSKSVSVSVTKTVTTVQQSAGVSATSVSATPMLTNTPLANIPVSLNATDDIPAVTTSDIEPVNVPVSISARNSSLIDTSKLLSSLDYDIDAFKNLEEALKRIANQLDLIDEKAKNSFGQEKIDLLRQQIPLLKQQQQIQEQISSARKTENSQLKSWLSNKGFSFTSTGEISNYQDKLLAMEQNVESLKKKYDNLNEANKRNETAIKNAKNAYESANETLSKTKDYLNEYFDSNNEIANATEKWWEYENAIKKAEEAIRETVNAQLEFKIDNMSDSIDLLDAKIKNMNGQEKIKYLEEQNYLYKEQQQLLSQLEGQMRRQLTALNPLSEEYQELYGRIMELSTEWWNLQNSISDNLSSIFEEKSTNVLENLGNQIDLLDAKMNNYNGEEKIFYLKEQVNLYREQQNQMHLLANELRYQLTLLDPTSKQYQEFSNEIMKLSTEWWKVEEAIKDATSEVEELNRQMKLLSVEAEIESLDELFTELQFQIDFIKEKTEYAWGTDKIDAMKDSIGLLNGQLDLQQQKLNAINYRLSMYQDNLKKYNLQFDERGNTINYSEVLESYKNSTQLEEIIDLYEEYKDAHEELQKEMIEYWKIENEIKDLQKEKLEITQDVEEEITKIIEKEYERRKDEIEKYTDERIELLEEEKKAYQDMRDKQEYEKSINEQTKEIVDLQKKLETAKKDNSIAGLKRQSEILKEIEEAQKKLEETTQERIDSDYESNIDVEIDRLEEEQEKLIASLDEKFSETNIAKMVSQAIASGFIEINGEVKTLQDALIQSINDSAEGYSVMANIIKNELISNLNVALNTMQQIEDINEKLGLQNFDVISATKNGITNIPTYTSGNSKTVTIGDTIINVSGSVDDITLSKIEDMIKEENEKMLREITNGI